MDNNTVRHLGNNFNLNISKLPCKAIDRYSPFYAVIFLLLALILISVGVYELLNGIRPSELEVRKFMSGQDTHMLLMSPTFFDLIIITMGVGIAVSMIFAIIRYKKVNFDGDFFRIVMRPVMSPKILMTEPLYAYQGVQLRTEFLQFGLINRTKYIIELLHKDDRKTIPLYISMSSKNIRKIWENYAKELRKPAIIRNEYATTERDYHDLDSSLRELINSGKLPKPQEAKTAMPKSLVAVRKGNNIVIKIKEVLFDAYNAIALMFLVLFSAGIAVTAYNHDYLSEYFSSEALLSVYVVSALFVIYCIILLIQRDKLVIKQEKVVLLHKFILLSIKSGEMHKDKIKEVEIVCNPASGRSYIALMSDDKSLVFGKKMPLSDLRWLRQYIIMELIK